MEITPLTVNLQLHSTLQQLKQFFFGEVEVKYMGTITAPRMLQVSIQQILAQTY